MGELDLGMSDMATLIREEQKRIFGDQVNEIVGLTDSYNNQLLSPVEFLAAVASTFGA
jgi:hypothetical protein